MHCGTQNKTSFMNSRSNGLSRFNKLLSHPQQRRGKPQAGHSVQSRRRMHTSVKPQGGPRRTLLCSPASRENSTKRMPSLRQQDRERWIEKGGSQQHESSTNKYQVMCRRGTMIVFPKMRYPPSDLRLEIGLGSSSTAASSGQSSTHAAGAHRVELLWTLRDVEVRKECCADDQWLERGRERDRNTAVYRQAR